MQVSPDDIDERGRIFNGRKKAVPNRRRSKPLSSSGDGGGGGGSGGNVDIDTTRAVEDAIQNYDSDY